MNSYYIRFRQWFDALESRERIMVIACGVVVALGLYYFLIWNPLSSGVDRLTTSIAADRELVSWLGGVQAEVKRLRAEGVRPAAGSGQSLISIIDQTSKNAGLNEAVSRIQPEGSDSARIWLEGAGFDATMRWLHTLETDYGVAVESITVSREDKPGLVRARISVERPV